MADGSGAAAHFVGAALALFATLSAGLLPPMVASAQEQTETPVEAVEFYRSGRAHFEAGRCFEVLGKKQQAIKSYQEVVKNHPESDQAAAAAQRLEQLNR